MSDALDRGITVTEIAAMDRPADLLRETTAVFVGRALRGPVNEPVSVNSFGEFQRRFGEPWSRSGLGPAVRLFFEHGGRQLYVVRVVNNARGAMICLPAGGSALILRALDPGSTEVIRAAVDYDGIPSAEDELFNLTVQRIDPLTGLLSDQELYRKASCNEDSHRFIADLLLTSSLARVEKPLPRRRPDATPADRVANGENYVSPAQPGTDGAALSDYDLIGSGQRRTGLYALQAIEHFDLLYLPPPTSDRDIGAAAILAAERYCRSRAAMLLIDPPASAESPQQVIDFTRQRGLLSSNVAGYFPRMYRRNDAQQTPVAVGAAMAGLLCKLDRNHGAWHDLDWQGLGFSRELVPSHSVAAEEQDELIRAGVNVVATGPAGSARLHGSVTLGPGSEWHRLFRSLPVRRLWLQMIGTIDAATRWAVFEPRNAQVSERIRSQVLNYLSRLAEVGALHDDSFVVECDAGLHKQSDEAGPGFAIHVAFRPAACPEPISFTLHQAPAGRQVTSTAFAPV